MSLDDTPAGMDRRSFLKLLGLGTAGLVVPGIVAPERRIWQVPRNAPVGQHVVVVHMDGTIEGTGDALVRYFDQIERTQAEAIDRLVASGMLAPNDAQRLAGIERERVDHLRAWCDDALYADRL